MLLILQFFPRFNLSHIDFDSIVLAYRQRLLGNATTYTPVSFHIKFHISCSACLIFILRDYIFTTNYLYILTVPCILFYSCSLPFEYYLLPFTKVKYQRSLNFLLGNISIYFIVPKACNAVVK